MSILVENTKRVYFKGMSNPNTRATVNFLKAFPLFANCTEGFFAALSQQCQMRPYQKGKVLFIQEDEAAFFYILQSGWVKLYRETLDGEQAIVDILTTGHIFGETSIFENGFYPYSAEIVEDANILVLPIAALKKEIEKNNAMALDMLSSMARYRREQEREIEHITLQNASQRIGCFLLRLRCHEKDGSLQIHLPYDKMLLASRLGMKPETFSRGLSKLKKQIGLKVKGATIEVPNLQELSDYVCYTCSSGASCIETKNAIK